MPTTSARPSRRRAVTLAGFALAAAAAPPIARATPRPVGRLTFFGAGCFLLESASGTRVVMDPFVPVGGTPPDPLRADIVTVSHEHPDHNDLALVTGRPKILRGLTADKKGWLKIDETIKDVQVRSVGVYHDAEKGAKRGLSTIFIFEVGGMRVVHLGDLGHLLDHKQLGAIGAVDVVLVPVGGGTTLDAPLATHVVEQLRPRLVVVPMHFKGRRAAALPDGSGTQAAATAAASGAGGASPSAARAKPSGAGGAAATAARGVAAPTPAPPELASVEPFVAGKRNVTRQRGDTLDLLPWRTKPAAQIVVLEPQ